ECPDRKGDGTERIDLVERLDDTKRGHGRSFTAHDDVNRHSDEDLGRDIEDFIGDRTRNSGGDLRAASPRVAPQPKEALEGGDLLFAHPQSVLRPGRRVESRSRGTVT